MTEWIDFRVTKPETDIVAIVSNCKGWMNGVRAVYYMPDQVWRLYDPNYRETILLDVTHYLPYPEPPR